MNLFRKAIIIHFYSTMEPTKYFRELLILVIVLLNGLNPH